MTDELLYPDDNEPSDGERRLYRWVKIVIGGLLIADAVFLIILGIPP